MDVKIVSHREQSRSVQKTRWRRVGCGTCLCFWFYHVLFILFFLFFRLFFVLFFVLVGESRYVSSSSCTLSTTSILCTYPVLWQLYICESEERKYPSKFYIFCSLILFFNCSLKNKTLWGHNRWCWESFTLKLNTETLSGHFIWCWHIVKCFFHH